MGRLVVEARGTAAEGPIVQGVAAVGNSDPMPLVVSVTDADGVPVGGLAVADFRIRATIVGAGGSLIEIASAGGGRQGDYVLRRVRSLSILPPRRRIESRKPYLLLARCGR